MSVSFTVLEQALTHYSTAGAAGGLVKSVSRRETLGRVILSTAMGGLSSYYLTPVLLWAVAFQLGLDGNKMAAFESVAPAAMGFFLGITTTKITEILERLLSVKGIIK